MRLTPFIQHPGAKPAAKLQEKLEALAKQQKYTSIQVAMAYATLPGVKSLLAACPHATQSEWLLGLDDFITPPGVLDYVKSLPGAILKVASLGSQGARFHPKICRLLTADGAQQLMMTGSANLTLGALGKNSEAVVFLEKESAKDDAILDALWSALWVQGQPLTPALLEDYRARYALAKPLRKKLQEMVVPMKKSGKKSAKKAATATKKPVGDILTHDTAELDPSQAEICWIECGSATAMGRELELKAEQALFFGLDPLLHKEQHFSFLVSNKKMVSLRIKYQKKNGMWRLQMNNEVPEVHAGLRPILPNGKLGRSKMVAVFSRLPKKAHFGLGFVHIDSKDFAALKDESAKLGTSSSTAGAGGRAYGWC